MAMTMRSMTAEPSRLISASCVISIDLLFRVIFTSVSLGYERATPRLTIFRSASAGAAFLLAFLGGECP